MKCLSFYHPLFPRRPTPKRQWWVPMSTAERGDWCLPCFSVSEKRKSEKPEPQTCRFGLLPLIMLWVSLDRGTVAWREVSDQSLGGQVAKPAAATWWEEHLGFLSMPWWRPHDGTAERCGHCSSQGPDTCRVNMGLKQTLHPGSERGIQRWGDQSGELFVINKKGETQHVIKYLHVIFQHHFCFLPPCPHSPRFSSVQFSHSVMSDSLWPHGLQHARPPCPSPTARVYSNSCTLSQWCHPTISTSVIPFSSLPSIFHSIRAFSNESALRIRWPKYWSFSFNISPSNEYSGLISFRMDWLDLLAVQGTLKSLLQHHSSKASILRCSAFFIVQLSHPYMITGKTIALTRWTFVGKVTSLLLKMLSRLVITFLPRSESLFISWLQPPSAVILKPPKIKSATVSTVSPSICHEMMGLDAMIFVFLMLSFKPTFSLSSFTCIKRLFNSSSLSAIRVVILTKIRRKNQVR